MKRDNRALGWKARTVAIGVLLMLISGFFPAFPTLLKTRLAHAQGGSISGTVTGGGGPLENVEVVAYVWSGDWGWWVYAGNARTGTDGTYEISGLEPGYYIVEFMPPSDSYYIGRFYDDQFMGNRGEEDTHDFWVDGENPATGIDAVLEMGGKISGQVTSASEPDGVDDVWVGVYDLGQNYITDAHTGWDNEGRYETRALPAGTYKLRIYPSWGSEYVPQWYDRKGDFGSADEVTVTVGETAEANVTLQEGGRISGRVTNAADEPLENVEVYAIPYYYWDDYSDYRAYTQADGTYEIRGLPTDQYRIRFNPPSGSLYLWEYYENTRERSSATPVDAVVGGLTEGIDAVLEMGGKISGRVTNAADEPLENVEVVAYVWSGDWGWWVYAGYARTGTDGTYEISGLEPGYYIVEFMPPSDSYYMGRFYDDQFMGNRGEEDTHDFWVDGENPATGIDAVLEMGGKISGQVTSASEPDGVDDVWVGVYDLGQNYITDAHTGWDNEGRYETQALPAGTYKLRIYPSWGSEYVPQWYDRKGDFDSADEVTVTVGETAEANVTLQEGGRISGRVTSASEPDGVPYVEVRLYSANDPDNYIYSTRTDWNNGTYSLQGILPGEYKVLFVPQWWYPDYAREWYEDKRSFETADVIAVGEGENLTGISVVLERNGCISGRVTGELDPDGLYGVEVLAYDLDENYTGRGGWTDSRGRYTITGLEEGSYKLYFVPYYKPAYGSRWYNDKPDFESADPVEVRIESETPDIDAHLVTGSLSGTVTSPDEPEGVSRVDVFVYDANGDYRGSTVTDESGTYTINNLPSGEYFVYVYPWWPNANEGRTYAFEWFEDKGAIEEADPVEVEAGKDTPHIDFSLESGSISGTVTGYDSLALEGVDVYVHDRYFHLVGTAATGAGGSYTVKGIRPGDYAVYFDPTWIRESQGKDYTGEYYDDRLSFYEADRVTVAGDVTGIDASLEAGSFIAGTVTSGGQPAAGVFVHAYRAGEPTYWVAYTETGADGSYRIGGLPPGDYRVSFNHASGQNYLDEWYDDAADFYAATRVSLPRGGGTSGIDADLATGGSVSGRVTGSDAPDGLEGVQVRVLDADYGFVGGTLTKADGSYSVGGLLTGTYYVEFYTGDPWSDDALNYRGEFYNDRQEWKDADPVSVTAGSDTRLDEAVLQRYATISGRVTGTGHADGLEGVEVYLYSESFWYKNDWTRTDASGFYSFDRVEGGSYSVYFRADGFNNENGTDYASEWYDDRAGRRQADILDVAMGEDLANVNAVLERAGRITGRVTSASRPRGVSGHMAKVYDPEGNFITQANTESDGYYEARVKPGTYKVASLSDYFYYRHIWYDGKSTLEEADPVTVTEGRTMSGIDFYLPGTGSISGKVTSNEHPDGVPGLNVFLYRADNPYDYFGTFTNDNGEYSLQDVPAGEYKVRFMHYYHASHTSKWYDGKGDFDSATTITVTEGAETKDIDAHFTDEASITGRVTDSSIPPRGLQDVWVVLYDTSHVSMASTPTNEEGYYTLRGLAPGDYKVFFATDSYASEYLYEWYKDKPGFEAADLVTVSVGTPTELDDAVLELGGSISGHVSGDDAPGGLEGVLVTIYGEGYFYHGHATTDENGDFRVGGLPTGEYRVRFYHDEYITEFYDDQPDFQQADPVSVTAGEDTPLEEVVLQRYASISGRVTSASQPDGVEGLHVYLYRADDPGGWVDCRVADEQGYYSFERLYPGAYKVAFSPISGMDYAEEWFDGQPDFERAEVIDLASGENREDINAFMDPGGSISGRVTSGSRPDGIEGVGVTAYTPDGRYARACHTEADGTYYLGGLATGEYLVRFDPGRMPYKGEWYEDKYEQRFADAVSVTAGSATTGIDAVLADSGSISGRVTSDAQPDGVGDVYVHAYPASDEWNWSGYAVTRGDGTYVIENLVPGEYRVIFNSSSGQNYKSLWYDGADSFLDARPVMVNERVNTGHIDGHLSEYASVSGRVTDGEGNGVPDVLVRFFKDGTVEVDSVLTDSEGRYERYNLAEGTYLVKFEPPFTSPCKAEWFDDRPDQASATQVNLSPGEKKVGVDAVLSVEGAPRVLWVNPDTGMDTQSLDDVFIFGSGFASEGYTLPRVLLMREGQAANEARDVKLIDANCLTCDLNLIEQASGPWDVVVVNPNGQGGRLESGFTVVHKPQPPTLLGPVTALVGQVGLHGTAEAGSTVRIYRRPQGEAEWNQVEQTEVNQHGNWNAAVDCPSEGTYEFMAKATNGGVVSDPSEILTVVVGGADLAVLTDYFANLHGARYDPDPETGVIYLSTFSGAEFQVRMRFSSAPDTVSFQFKGTSYPVTGPDASGWYTATVSGWTWSPGVQQGKILYNDNGMDFQQAVLEVVLIDPSGYVYDLGTGQKVQGARATLQYWFGGSWRDWPADEYGQANPQYTDDEGRYGWDVHPGKYRVLVAKDTYQGATSEEVTVPPEVTDLNIGLRRNAPSITSITPTTGKAGDRVTIRGTCFGAVQAGSKVTFAGDKNATAVSWNDTDIVCTVPVGAVSGDVVVVTAGGTSNGVSFTVQTPPPSIPRPTITSINPAKGKVGDTVIIGGEHFGASRSASSVIFAGNKTAAVVSWSDTVIVCTVPVGAVSGDVVVVTAGGTSNGVWFEVEGEYKPAQGTTWYLAEGYTGGDFDTWVLV
ncbi:MAG: carboxypeptidase regulatory-like domain-containing protein, partial [Actinomycetota bacterium]|nr:carboxypeptidase regulatory-like domain-containing protein [Actinomycetota bacterium]